MTDIEEGVIKSVQCWSKTDIIGVQYRGDRH